MSPAEKETIVRFDDADSVAHVYTCHARIASHLIRRRARPIRVDRRGRRTPASWTFEIPLNWFKVPGPRRNVSEAQRSARREAMKARHSSKISIAGMGRGAERLPVEGTIPHGPSQARETLGEKLA
jgi:hypothetical protein